jgi:hypothetical protein
VQMCSFFSMICCKRLENASRYECSLIKLSLVMNISYLGFDGPSEQSHSVSRAKTHKTLKYTFGSFWGLWKILWESTLSLSLFTGKAKVHWSGGQFDLSSLLEAKSPTEMFTATLTYFSDPGLQDPRRASLALSSRKLVLHTEKSEK